MSVAATVVALVARTLPAPIRARYHEEWLADLDGAAELGLSGRSIVGGAISTSATLDRGDPAVSGMPRSALTARRVRWAVGLFGGAVVLAVGLFFWGGFRGFALEGMVGAEALAVAGFVLEVLAAILVVGGALAALSAVINGTSAFGLRRTILAIVAIPIGVVVVAAASIVPGVLGVLGVMVGAVVLLVVGASGHSNRDAPAPVAEAGQSAPSDRDASAPVPRARRVLLALPWSLLTLIAIGTGVLHITVWNPLAKLPGMTLDEIYTAMAAADQGTGSGIITGWAVIWSLVAIALPIACAIPRWGRVLTARRILVLGLLMVGMTVCFQWIAGFSMGMNLADTFMTSGSNAAATGPVLTIVGMLALVTAILVALAPARRPLPSPLT